jgi:diguanylate cyclase (GGDEF)-like protein
MKRLRALEILEERRLAGVVAGLMYLTGAVTVSLILWLPGVDRSHWPWVLLIAGLGAAWGLAAVFLVPWDKAPPIVSHLSSSMGFPIVMAGMALTGGASSPARFLLFFVIVYAAYFYPPTVALPYLLGSGLVLALPLVYDSAALGQAYMGEVVILVPLFLVLGGLIMAGKGLLVDLSRHDVLTGLVNRRAFADELRRHTGGRPSGEPVGLVLMDLDGFKEANTIYGHPGGDAVLQQAAAALRAAVRADDMVARLGGDEFAVVAVGADEDGLRALAERVRDELIRADGALELPEFTLRASVGWALYPRDADKVEDLIAIADRALRDAKCRGKDQFVSPVDWLGDRTGPAGAAA